MTANPFLTVHGPRPERWWAVCNLCGQTSSARFENETEAGEWEHDCHTPTEDDGTCVVTIEVSIDDPPKINWTGVLTHARQREVSDALHEMDWWCRSSYKREQFPSWSDAVADGWQRKRRQVTEAAIAEMEKALEMPYPCPGCGHRCKTVGGLKNHMRACWQIDPFKLKRGEYDDQMVPGGAPISEEER